MKKDQVDLENKVVRMPDSKTATGVAEVPLTELAVEAFRDQTQLAGEQLVPVSERRERDGTPDHVQDGLAADPSVSEGAVLPHLRSALDLCDASEGRRRSRRVGEAAPSPGGRQGVQEILADEAADEARGAADAQSHGQQVGRSSGTGRVILGPFWNTFRRKSETNITVRCENAIESKEFRVGA
jgi:hypothetical protein